MTVQVLSWSIGLDHSIALTCRTPDDVCIKLWCADPDVAYEMTQQEWSHVETALINGDLWVVGIS